MLKGREGKLGRWRGNEKYGLTQNNPGIQLQFVLHPTARASAATCVHPEELKAPGVQSSPALVWSLHSSGQKEQRNSFHGGKSPPPRCSIKACFLGNVPKDGVIWAVWIRVAQSGSG